MTIRTRLTVWYAAIFSVSLLVIGVSMYSELVVEQRAKIARHLGGSVDEDAGTDITQIIFFYGGAAVAVGALGGWWLTRRALAPVMALTAAVEKIHENNLGGKIPYSGNGDELDRLTEVFNAMTTRLNESFHRIREFTLHASHELKTPLTILCGETWTASPCSPRPTRDKLCWQQKRCVSTNWCATILPTLRFSPSRSTSKSNWKSARKFSCAATGTGCANCY